MAKSKARAPKLTTVDDAGRLLANLGKAVAWRLKLNAQADREVAAVLLKYNGLMQAAGAEIALHRAALKRWADKNRKALCGDGSKTITLPTGEISWRLGPEAVELDEGYTEEAVIEALLQGAHSDCVRITKALDKEQIKKLWPHLDEAGVAGLRLVQREFCDIKPASLDEPVEVKTKTVEVIDRLDGNPKKEKQRGKAA